MELFSAKQQNLFIGVCFIVVNILLAITILLVLVQIPIIYFLVMVIRSLQKVFNQAMSTAGLALGRTIPKFKAKSLTTGNVITNEAIQNKPTLIGFVSHNCKRCKAMLPFWNEAYMNCQDKINFVLIGHGENEEFTKLLEVTEMKGELLADIALFEKFKAKIVAFAYFVDEDGKVLRKGLIENKDDIDGLLGLDG